MNTKYSILDLVAYQLIIINNLSILTTKVSKFVINQLSQTSKLTQAKKYQISNNNCYLKKYQISNNNCYLHGREVLIHPRLNRERENHLLPHLWCDDWRYDRCS